MSNHCPLATHSTDVYICKFYWRNKHTEHNVATSLNTILSFHKTDRAQLSIKICSRYSYYDDMTKQPSHFNDVIFQTDDNNLICFSEDNKNSCTFTHLPAVNTGIFPHFSLCRIRNHLPNTNNNQQAEITPTKSDYFKIFSLSFQQKLLKVNKLNSLSDRNTKQCLKHCSHL